MPLDLADALYAHLLDRFPDDRDYPRRALHTDRMPPLVASVLGRTLDRWLEHKLDQLDSAWFDFEDAAVKAARAELVTALGRTARVPQHAWAETLDYAVSLAVRYLVTPARALTDATFEGDADPLPSTAVRARLRTFAAYPYLAEVVEAYLSERRPEALDPDALYALLVRVDRRYTEGYGPEEWLRLLGPLYTLARFVPGLDGVPTGTLAQFFEAKGRERIAARLHAEEAEVMDEAALHALLEAVRPAAPAAPRSAAPDSPITPKRPAPRPAPKPETAPEPAPDEEATSAPEPSPPSEPAAPPDRKAVDQESEEDEPASEDRPPAQPAVPTPTRAPSSGGPPTPPAAPPEPPSSEEGDEPQPLWKRFARPAGGPTTETAIPAVPPPPAAPPPKPEPTAPEAGDDAEPERPLWQRFFRPPDAGAPTAPPDRPTPSRPAEPAGTPTQKPAASTAPPSRPRADAELDKAEAQVLGRASESRRKRFVARLFDGDEAAYADLLARLERAKSWAEASQIIARDCFRAYDVDIYDPAAVEFTDAVQKRFERA